MRVFERDDTRVSSSITGKYQYSTKFEFNTSNILDNLVELIFKFDYVFIAGVLCNNGYSLMLRAPLIFMQIIRYSAVDSSATAQLNLKLVRLRATSTQWPWTMRWPTMTRWPWS